MKTKEIQELICRKEVLALNPVCENLSYFLGHEMDVCSINKSGFITEYEVKISKSDFIADSKKRKWKYFNSKMELYIPNYFYYVCPTGLIIESQIPEYAGLIYVEDNSLSTIKKASLIHKHKHNRDKALTKFCKVLSQRQYLGSCLLTYKVKKLNETGTF